MSVRYPGIVNWRSCVAIAACFVSLFTFQGASRAQEPYASGEGYRAVRQSLLAKGWTPVSSYGLKTASGKSLYRYPEVVCGPTLCNAKWRDGGGEERLISLVRGQGDEDHRVAPQ
ncbi:hypothetical protein [Methylocystis sp. ATCC 49242]|uniref:hypothetical protein n=1 Tax=Methylocystis sp. ATCC 49242 TaxID=622637 RepID=UPI0001F87830|nr:hypothetical protein [Methylocystis sp. ATCC 49242]